MSSLQGQQSSSAAAATSRCRLLELPAELRLRIYEFTFPHETIYIQAAAVVHTRRKDEAWTKSPDGLPSFCAGLLRASTLIYREASPILYERTTFIIDLKPMSHKGVSGQKLCAIQDFVISAQVQKVYLHLQHRYRPRYGPLGASRVKDDWSQVIRAVLMALSYCASASHVHLELDTKASIDGQYVLSHFEPLQCSGEVSIRMPNMMVEDAPRFHPVQEEFIDRMGAKVQACTWHK